jgi:transcriptional regulator with XRE-family HTH domain
MAEGTRESSRLGAKVRALRRCEQLTQVQLAERIGISPSYLNLIESNRRPLPATLLIKLAQVFDVDVHAFATDEDAHVISDLLEAFSDPLFEAYGLTAVEMRELVTTNPALARAVLPTRSRAFQIAHQIALLTQQAIGPIAGGTQ